jgi:hypothetical protein
MVINIIGNGVGRKNGLAADGQKWTVNRYDPGADMMFDMHPPGMYPRHAEQRVRARQAGQDVITLDNYPIDTITEAFGTEYFSNSIPFMIALAIFQGASKIRLWGCHINQQPGDEEVIAKNHPGVEYWIGRAEGIGIRVEVNGDSMLMSCRDGMYGYRWIKDYGAKSAD